MDHYKFSNYLATTTRLKITDYSLGNPDYTRGIQTIPGVSRLYQDYRDYTRGIQIWNCNPDPQILDMGSRKKKVLYLVARPLRPLVPSLGLVAIGTFFLNLFFLRWHTRLGRPS